MRDMEEPPYSLFTNVEVAAMREHLLAWYDKNHRVLPWRINSFSKHQILSKVAVADARGDGKPTAENDRILKGERGYAVWISEVMSQQTRISVVMDYYMRWIKKWPTIEALSNATMEEVNEMWAGLGYYRRAKFLLEGAKYIMSSLKGQLPSSASDLVKIPGIGRYTAGAIASIAFSEVTPVVDGNVVRVLSRLRVLSGDPKQAEMVRAHWALAEQLVDPDRPGDFNQALMELGATVCSATSPSCSLCPVSSHCAALAQVQRYCEGGEGGMEEGGESRRKKGRKKVEVEMESAAGGVKFPSVTDYPSKVVKARPREEHVAVCMVHVVKRRGRDDMAQEVMPANALKRRRSQRGTAKALLSSSSSAAVEQRSDSTEWDRSVLEVLLVKRPAGTGLLAGQWEFPCVEMSRADMGEEERRDVMDKYLMQVLGIRRLRESGFVVGRREVGVYRHVFSHVHQYMHVELMVVQGVHGKEDLANGNLVSGEGTELITRLEKLEIVEKMGLTSGIRKVLTMAAAIRDQSAQ